MHLFIARGKSSGAMVPDGPRTSPLSHAKRRLSLLLMHKALSGNEILFQEYNVLLPPL